MRLRLESDYSTGKSTPGRLLYSEPSGMLHFLCFTLEDVVREVPRLQGESTEQWIERWKIWGQTAIPAGTYRVTLEMWPKKGKEFPRLHDVPGFTGIWIHGGNTDADTHGCPLVGMERDTDVIRKCGVALDALRDLLRKAEEKGEESFLTVVRAASNPVVSTEENGA